MNTQAKTILGGLVVILVLIGAWFFYSHAHTAAAKVQVRATVTDFASHLQNVSLLAPTAGTDIESTYAPYVDADLLAKWNADPSSAPGRQTSSPWPDHIDITSVQETNGGAYKVNGRLVLMTSNEVEHGGDAGSASVSMTLRNEKGSWKITEYSQGPYNGPAGMATSTASTTPDDSAPVQQTQPSEPATTTATSTQAGTLHVSAIAPSSGDAGTRIIMTGSGFTSTSQVILDGGRGAISNVQANVDGTVLTFIMPDSVGAYCAPKHACPLYALLLKPGAYDLAVRNTDGATSNAVTFTLTGTTGPIR